MAVVNGGAKRTDAVSDVETAEMIVREIAKTCVKSSLIFHIGLITSLRGCDIRSLSWAEVEPLLVNNVDSFQVKQQKTGALVKVKMSPALRSIFSELYNTRGSNTYVFEHNTNRSFGKPISRSKVHSEIQNASKRLKEAGVLPEGFVLGQHSARKAVSSMMFNDGVDISIISKKLGHRTTTATLNYLGITEKRVEDIADAYDLSFGRK